LVAVIETSRAAVLGQPIAWGTWGMAFVFCLGVSILGYAFFQHSRDEFADAL
jgi:lipopolysaccharide transport system permease protein